MPDLPESFSFALHAGILTVFVGATSVLMLTAVIHRLRVRRPLFVWRPRRLRGLPIAPTLFLLAVSGVFVASIAAGRPIPPHVLVGYPAGGVFWWIARWIARSKVVTEYGIIHDVTRISQAVSWSQMTDYFIASDGHGPYAAFFYSDDDGERRRLTLPVPPADLPTFKRLLSRKIDHRFEHRAQEAYDSEALGE